MLGRSKKRVELANELLKVWSSLTETTKRHQLRKNGTSAEKNGTDLQPVHNSLRWEPIPNPDVHGHNFGAHTLLGAFQPLRNVSSRRFTPWPSQAVRDAADRQDQIKAEQGSLLCQEA